MMMIPEDCLIKILSKLPAKTICKLKTVSKTFLKLISDPFFQTLHKNHLQTLCNAGNDGADHQIPDGSFDLNLCLYGPPTHGLNGNHLNSGNDNAGNDGGADEIPIGSLYMNLVLYGQPDPHGTDHLNAWIDDGADQNQIPAVSLNLNLSRLYQQHLLGRNNENGVVSLKLNFHLYREQQPLGELNAGDAGAHQIIPVPLNPILGWYNQENDQNPPPLQPLPTDAGNHLLPAAAAGQVEGLVDQSSPSAPAEGSSSSTRKRSWVCSGEEGDCSSTGNKRQRPADHR